MPREDPDLRARTEQEREKHRKANGDARNKPDIDQEPPRRILRGAEFVATTRAPDWVVDGIVQRGRLYSCTSLTGHGKTAVWLYNGCMVHTARKIGHLETEPGNVLILAGENPEDLQLRMLGMGRAFNLDPQQLPYVLPDAFPMTEDEADSLRAEIDALCVPFMLVIGDTTASFFPGEDENDNVQAGRYGRTLRTLTQCRGNPAIISLSHPVKNAARDNLLPRGGGAFLNELDGNLTLWSSEVGETTTLHWQGKIRGPDFDPFTYRLKPVETGLRDRKERDTLTIVADPLDDFEAADRTAQKIANEDAALKILQAHPRWSQAEMANTLGWLDKNGKPEKYRVGRSFQALKKLGFADNPRGRWEVTDKGKKALDKHKN
jgi:hypothetical protein